MITESKIPSTRLDEQLIREKQERCRRLLIEVIVKGKSPPSKASRMLTISEGVIECWEGSDRFEAAVHTDEGPKSLEGMMRGPRENVDVQSGPLVCGEPAIKEADQAIRFAYDNQEPYKALNTISRIWEHLDRASELAAARSCLLMGKLDKPLLAELPKWFEDQEPALHDDEEGEITANPLAVESAALLVRAALAAVGGTDDLEAEVATGPLSRVIIDWEIPGLRLEWMVEATDLPWPSVKVYQVFRPADTGDPKPAETQIFHNAFDVAESFVRLLRAK